MTIGSDTTPLRQELEAALPDRPFGLRFWDGSELPATANGSPVPLLTARSPRGVAHALLAPGQLGLSRAYVSGELEVDDLDALIVQLRDWQPPPIDAATKRRLLLGAARAVGIMLPPRRPNVELRPRGRRHSVARDRRAVRHHYDVSNEFFALFLDESMTYSCAIFEDPLSDDEPLESAQQRKLETLSEPQAQLARARAAAAGVEDKVEIRVADYRELNGERFDAVASIGMVEHVGNAQIDVYARQLAGLLKPGGRLLNHGIARLRQGEPEAGSFSERYVFPDAAPLHLSRVQLALERAGFVTEHVEGYQQHYARTLTHWLTKLDANAAQAERLAGPERMRVWRLYLRAARSGFQSGFTSIYQVRCRLA
jgi:cyclopropane-fatty-acyl-phospholipid synthase